MLTIDIPYRMALAIILLLTIGAAAYYRWQAHSRQEPVSRREEGYLFAIVLRISGLVLLLATLTYLFRPDAVSWSSLPLPAWLRWSGFVCGVPCSGLMFWTLQSLGNNLTDTVVTRANASLITSGPYRWVRHPYYSITGILMLSASLLSANGLIAATSLMVLGLLVIRTPLEEKHLVERFGQSYLDYAANTGRFLPKLYSK